MTNDDKVRTIHNWTAQFEIGKTKGSGINRSMDYARIHMNTKHDPLIYYYENEDEAISTTYEKMRELVWHTING